jgi:subtilisin family serine protease
MHRFTAHLAWLLLPASLFAGAVPEPSGKIAPWVLEHTASGNTAEILVVLRDQANLNPARTVSAKVEKGRFVFDELRAVADATQRPVLDILASHGAPSQAFFIVNAIWTKADRGLVDELAARADVDRIEGNPVIHNDLPRPEPGADSPDAVEPGVTYIHAPEVWALGYTGQGIVIAGQDTGYQWDHPAIKPHYRGWNGTLASHDYNWHDSIHDSVGNPCGNDAPAPCDDYGHGTHTIGTATGDDGGTNQIGVAPGAKWIGCRNMDQGNGTPARYIECFQWELAPTQIGGGNPDPTKSPDLTTNSWDCPASEGCSVATLQSAVDAQRAAGIMPVAAAGNSGSGCSTVSDPPSFYDSTYTIGAFSSSTGTIASFSSRGPVTVDGSNRMKPDISAPGVSVRSCVPTNSYAVFSGTSMATPHTAGAIALLWSAVPSLKNQMQPTEDLLNNNATHVTDNSCGSSGNDNNVYGWGRLNILAAVNAAICPTPPTATASGTNTTFCAGQGPAQLTGSGATSCSWTPTTGLSNAASCTPTANPASTTTYTLRVTDAGGCVSTNNPTVTVTVNPAPSASASGTNTTFCAGSGPANLTGSGGTSCSWAPSTGLSDAASCTPTANPASTTTYTLTVTSAAGCVSINNPTVTVTVNPAPSASASGTNTTFCAGQGPASLTGSGGTSCSWSPATGLSNAASCTPTANPASTTTYTLTVMAAGCASINNPTVTVTVNPLPTASITAPSGVHAYSIGNTATAADAGVGATYAWTITNGSITAGMGTTTITFDAGSASPITLGLTVTSAQSCQASTSQDVTVSAPGSVLGFYTVAPCRVIDTRRPNGTFGGPPLAGNGATRDFPISSQCGIPADAQAVALNVTVVVATAAGDLRLFPTGTPAPASSAINFRAARTRANNVLLSLTGNPLGSFTVQCDIPGGSTHMLVDVVGYFK